MGDPKSYVTLRDLLSVSYDENGRIRAVFIDENLKSVTRLYDTVSDVAGDAIDFAQGVCPPPQELPSYYTEDELTFSAAEVSALPGVRVENGAAFYSDIPVPVAPGVLNEVITASTAGNSARVDAVWAFWARLANNPDQQARADLMRFILANDMVITENGFFIAYRNAVVRSTGEADRERVLEIQKAYLDAILHGHDPKKITMVGSSMDLQTMYETMYETYGELVLTDHYSGSTTIRPGIEPVRMRREDCNSDPHATCSRGLHVASASWLSKGYFGDTTLLCIVDPSKVVAVPYDYKHGKMRVCEYFPVGVIERDSSGNIPKYPINTLSLKYDSGLEYEYGRSTLDAALIKQDVSYSDSTWNVVADHMNIIASRVESAQAEAALIAEYDVDPDEPWDEEDF